MLKQERLLLKLDMIGCNSTSLYKTKYLAIFKLINISNPKKYDYLFFSFSCIEEMYDELKCLTNILNYNSVEELADNEIAVFIEYDEQHNGKKQLSKIFRKTRKDAWPNKLILSEFVPSLFSIINTKF